MCLQDNKKRVSIEDFNVYSLALVLLIKRSEFKSLLEKSKRIISGGCGFISLETRIWYLALMTAIEQNNECYGPSA